MAEKGLRGMVRVQILLQAKKTENSGEPWMPKSWGVLAHKGSSRLDTPSGFRELVYFQLIDIRVNI